jgi:hypothetical protein
LNIREKVTLLLASWLLASLLSDVSAFTSLFLSTLFCPTFHFVQPQLIVLTFFKTFPNALPAALAELHHPCGSGGGQRLAVARLGAGHIETQGSTDRRYGNARRR